MAKKRYFAHLMIALTMLASLVGADFAQAARVARTTTLETGIADVLSPEASGESYRLLSTTDGRIYDVPVANARLASQVRELSPGATVRLTLRGDQVVALEAIAVAPSGESLASETFGFDTFVAPSPSSLGYEPTRLASYNDTYEIFNALQFLNGNSQCYQRAHVWARQMWDERSIKSMKVFLFFTHRYIREYGYKWWFHVAPFVYAADQEVVLDPTFTRSPLSMRDWTDSFVTSHADCPEVERYTDYEKQQEAQHCYTLKLPMFYYQPKDGETLAEKGTLVSEWREWDVSHSTGARFRKKRRFWPF